MRSKSLKTNIKVARDHRGIISGGRHSPSSNEQRLAVPQHQPEVVRLCVVPRKVVNVIFRSCKQQNIMNSAASNIDELEQKYRSVNWQIYVIFERIFAKQNRFRCKSAAYQLAKISEVNKEKKTSRGTRIKDYIFNQFE